jgi:hypothetical protein
MRLKPFKHFFFACMSLAVYGSKNMECLSSATSQ